MKVLVACEESQTVCKAFRIKGHEAYSCDIIECSGGHPEWHIQDDVLNVIDSEKWDIMIAHPPCTHLAVSGARHFKEKREDGRQQAAIDFFMKLINASINKICVENPICIMSTQYKKPTQIIHPYMFGDNSTKSTCLWLKNLSKLEATNIIIPEKHITKNGRVYDKWWYETSCISNLNERSKVRSKTFQGIANAMADQWG